MKRMNLVFCFFSCSFAMTSVAQKIKPIKVGDVVPDIQFTLLSPNGKESAAKLSDYKGKLVILDFWATWCGGCIKGLPRMDSLQKRFKNKISVLLVNQISTYDTKEKINNFFNKWNPKHPNFSIPTIYEDSLFGKVFPNRSLPHYVWIGVDGSLIATTNGKQITELNIQEALTTNSVNVTSKRDFFYNKMLFLGGEENLNLMEFEQFSFFKKGRIDGLTELQAKGSGLMGQRRNAMRNTSLLEIFLNAAGKLNPELKSDRRVVLEVCKPETLSWNYSNESKAKTERDVWEKNNLYTYDILIPESEIKTDKLALPRQMLSDINRYSSYIGSIERRKVKCLVLVRTSGQDKIKSKGKASKISLNKEQKSYIVNLPIKILVSELNEDTNTSAPILDETGYTGNVDIELGYYGRDVQKLRNELGKYDLDLIEAEREIEMFVIRDKKPFLIKSD